MNFEFLTFLAIVYSISMGKAELITDLNIRQLPQIQNKCDLTIQPQCSSDCSSILVCVAGNENPAESIKCHYDTPFCDKGTCTAKPGSCSLNRKASSFLCTSKGVFPDPTDCTKYHHCFEPGSLSTEHECPKGNIYNSKLKVCQKGVPRKGHSSRKICEKINCDHKQNEFITFPANPTFYIFCSVSNWGSKQIFIYRCEETHIFDSRERSCIFNCPSSGYFADILDCSVYYICNGHRIFTSQRVKCPTGYYFNGSACVNSSTHCKLGSTFATAVPSLMGSSTQAQNLTGMTMTTQTSQSSAQTFTNSSSANSSPTSETVSSSTDSTPMPEIQIATLPTFSASSASILFLPCPLWLKNSNDQICSHIGSYLNYGNRKLN